MQSGEVRVVWVFSRLISGRRVGYIEGVLEIASGMLLGDVERVKVPESSFNEAGCISISLNSTCTDNQGRYRLVGISSKPISKKICLNSVRTLLTTIAFSEGSHLDQYSCVQG